MNAKTRCGFVAIVGRKQILENLHYLIQCSEWIFQLQLISHKRLVIIYAVVLTFRRNANLILVTDTPGIQLGNKRRIN